MIKKIKDWLLIILMAIVGVFFMLIFRKKPEWIKKKQKEIKQKENEIDNNVEKIKQSRKEREEKAEELSEDLRETDYKFRNRFFSIMLIFLLILSPFTIASDGEPPPMSKEDLKIPDTYEELLQSYYAMFDYAMHYREIAYKYEKLYQQEKQEFQNPKKKAGGTGAVVIPMSGVSNDDLLLLKNMQKKGMAKREE